MRKRDDRGGVAVFTAAMTVLLVVAAAFAVDLGKQRVVRADVQALADAVALDAARLLDGRTASNVKTPPEGDWRPSLAEAVEASRLRNSAILGEVVDVTPTLVFLDIDPLGASVVRRDPDTSAIVPVGDDEIPDAVMITVTGRIGFSFAPVIGIDSGSATRFAIATAEPWACLALGSYSIGVENDGEVMLDALMDGLLPGSNANMTLAGYQGLASANVTVAQLVPFLPGNLEVSELNVADADDLLQLELTAGDFVTAVLGVLSDGQDVDLSTSAISTLTNFATAVETSVDLGMLDDFSLGEMLGIQRGTSSALLASFNALDLIVGALEVANGQYAFEIPAITVSTSEVPTVGALGAGVRMTGSAGVFPAPRQGCGPRGTEISTSAISLDEAGLTVGLNKGKLPDISALFGQFDIEDVSAEVSVDEALSTAKLEAIVCGRTDGSAGVEGIDVSVASTLVGLAVSVEPIRVTGTMRGSGIVVDLSASLPYGISTQPPVPGDVQQFRTPPSAYGDVLEFSSGAPLASLVPESAQLDLNGTLKTPELEIGFITFPAFTVLVVDGSPDLSALPPAVGELVQSAVDLLLRDLSADLIKNAVNPMISVVNWLVADPLAFLFGLTVAGTDVFPRPRPSCDGVSLRG